MEGKWKHVAPGFALDLTVNDPLDGLPWDFSHAGKRNRARALLREQKPLLLIGSPECKAFSTWMVLNRARARCVEAIDRALARAKKHLEFVASLYEEQLEGGRYFLHEHPLYASSWKVPAIEAVWDRPGVQRVHGDQCQFGAEVRTGPATGRPVKKPSGFMTNSACIAASLNKQCKGTGGWCSRPRGGKHELCSGRVAAGAQVYLRGLCRAVLKGITDQLRADGLVKSGCYGIQVADDDLEVLKETYGPAQGYSGRYRDDLTGQVLKDTLVAKARAVELDYFNSKGVWRKVPRKSARATTGKSPITVRWVDTNKGDEQNPNYRSRLVARQLKAHDHSGASFFAPAPPLEALRTVLSLAMTNVGSHRPDWDRESPNRTQVSLIDVRRAYFNAVIDKRDKPTFVDLPSEDPDHVEQCGQLLRHMYGTRGAADGWQEEYSTMLVRHGFRQGNACPNFFYHPIRHISVSVHGDDFTSSGGKLQLDWFEASVAEEYEIVVGPRLGPGVQDAKEGRALNRVIRWCEEHIEYEADPRQVERLIAECGLEGAKGYVTPSVKATFRELEEDDDLPQSLHTAFRGAAARANYLAMDRIDCQYASKEICRYMAKPTAHAWKALKRLCRYYRSAPRIVYEFRKQSVDCIDVYTDTDWAGCPRTRKSTSGGVVMLGQHAMKHWSSTQTSTALSSGEAEFAGVIRGSGQGLGYQALLEDLGIKAPLRVWTDSSAAIGICSRQGLGKMRHLDTHTLWIQQAVRSKRIDLRKISGEENPADLLTKHSSSQAKLEYLVRLFGCRYCDGRPSSAPMLRRGESTKVTLAQAAGDVRAVMGGNAKDLDHVPLRKTRRGARQQATPHTEHPERSLVGNATSTPARRSATGNEGTIGDDSTGDTAAMEETFPIMPHLQLSGEEIEALHPRILAPPEEPLWDLACDNCDQVYQHGLQLARELQEATDERGRRRHVHNDNGAATTTTTTAIGAANPTTKRVSIGPATTKMVSIGPAAAEALAVGSGSGTVDARNLGRTPTSRAAATPKPKRGEPKGTAWWAGVGASSKQEQRALRVRELRGRALAGGVLDIAPRWAV